MFIPKLKFSQDDLLQLKVSHITKQIKTLQLFGLIISGFIALNGLLLISETLGIGLLVIAIFGSFFTYLCTQGAMAVILLLIQIEINTRP